MRGARWTLTRSVTLYSLRPNKGGVLVFAESYVANWPAYCHPSDPRLASESFAVAKDESRYRFIGDRRPLNSREGSIGLAHLPCCPHDSGQIGDGADHNSRYQRLFLPLRSSSLTRGKTSDRPSHPPNPSPIWTIASLG